MSRTVAVLATLAAGALVAFQPPANAELGKRVGILAAAFISILVSLVIVGIVLVATGKAGEMRNMGSLHAMHLLGGIGGAVIVTVSLVTVRELGAGGVVAVTVCTQLVVSAIIDRLGWLGLSGSALDWRHIVGYLMLIVGTVLVTLRPGEG